MKLTQRFAKSISRPFDSPWPSVAMSRRSDGQWHTRLLTNGGQFSLSLRERAGVRDDGGQTHSQSLNRRNPGGIGRLVRANLSARDTRTRASALL